MIEFDVKNDQLYACYNDGSFPAFFAHVSLPIVLTAFPDSNNEWFIGALRDNHEDSTSSGQTTGWSSSPRIRATTP